MRILMLGWEFPPHVTGGLGAACEGLVRSLTASGHHVRFMLPVSEKIADSHDSGQASPDKIAVQPVSIEQPPRSDSSQPVPPEPAQVAQNAQPIYATAQAAVDRPAAVLQLQRVPARFVSPYARPRDVHAAAETPTAQNRFDQQQSADTSNRLSIIESPSSEQYQGDLFADADRFSERCVALLEHDSETFDVVHAHDWLTFRAGLAVGRSLGLPVVLHVHSLEDDRCPGFANARIQAVERDSLHEADHVIAVSNRTRDALTNQYNLPAANVTVAYNGIDFASIKPQQRVSDRVSQPVKTVLFVGRMTDQKGAGYLLEAASLIRQKDPNVRFVLSGSGDALQSLIEQTARMKLGSHVLFTGHLNTDEVETAMRKADLLVMPSVSEPFGLVALEAVRAGLPVILSTTSGAAEVIHHSLKVDYWDAAAMADRILSVLHRPALASTLRSRAKVELTRMTWAQAAESCLAGYRNALSN